MLTAEELMKASKTYEHGYDDCCEAGFKQALKVAAELGWDPWKIAVRKTEAMIVAANATREADKISSEKYEQGEELGEDWYELRALARKRYSEDHHLELLLAMMWAKPLGLWPTHAEGRASMWVLGSRDAIMYNHSFFDHAYYFRTGEQFVIASHPYNVGNKFRQAAAEWCEDHGVNVEYPDFPTWWNYGGGAGGTTLVVWKGNGERNRGFKGWLAKAEETDDPEGDLIREMITDDELPNFSSLPEMRGYLLRRGASAGAIEATTGVWERWVKEVMRGSDIKHGSNGLKGAVMMEAEDE